MAQVQESVDVNVPVRTAYNQWTQFESFPQFMAGVESITQIDDTHNHWVTKVGDALGVVKRRVKGDLERFKELIEARGTESGAWRGEVDQSATH